MFFSKKKQAASKKSNKISIDVGHHSIKLAYSENNEIVFKDFPIFDTPTDIMELDRQELMGIQKNAIENAIKTIPGKQMKNAEIMLSPAPALDIITRLIYKPSNIKLNNVLLEELPFEADKMAFDTSIVKSASQKLSDSIKSTVQKLPNSIKKSKTIAVSAMNIDDVKFAISLMGKYHRNVKVLRPDHVALLNYLIFTRGPITTNPLILIDFGSNLTHIIIYKNNDLFVSRTINIGGDHIEREYMKQESADFGTAQRQKFNRTIINDNFLSNKIKSSLSIATKNVLSNLVDEVKRTISYFEDFFVENIPDSKILLAGGGSKLKNIDRFIQNELGMNVSYIQNLYTQKSSEVFFPDFASAAGLMVKDSHPEIFQINLLKNIGELKFEIPEGEFYLLDGKFFNKKEFKKQRKKYNPNNLMDQLKSRDSDTTTAPEFDMPEIFKDIQKKLQSFIKGEKIEEPLSVTGFRPSIKDQLKLFSFLLLTIFFVLLIFNQFFWAGKYKRLQKGIGSLCTAQNKLLTTKISLERSSPIDETGVVFETLIDKVIWTTKLKDISKAIPKDAWISNMEINSNTEDYGKDEQLVKQSLELSCHVTSRSYNHLNTIAKFIENLEKNTGFREQFKRIEFHSAEKNEEDKSNVVNFTLTLPLARAMIKERKKEVKSDLPEESFVEKIKKRNEAMERLIR